MTNTCQRCGAFSETLATVSTQSLCADCITRLAANRYWPSGYLMGIGALLNPTAAAVLAGLNHRRLGEAKEARSWFIAAGVAGLVYVIVIAADIPIPGSALLAVGVGTGISIGKTWEGPWKVLQARGAQRANLWLPVLASVMVIIAVVVVLAAREVVMSDE